MKTLLLFCLLFSFTQVHATEWKLAKNDDGIKIETRSVEGEAIKEFRAQVNIETSLNSIISLMYDLERNPEWFHDCESLTLDEEITAQNRWLYLVNHAPWPLRTRDAYLHIITEQDPVTKVVIFDITTQPQRKIVHKDRVRIQRLRGGWVFEPKADNSVDVTYAMFVDPGGSVPKALANMVVVDNPYNTLKGMVRMIESGDYDDATVDWVSEL